MFSVIYYELFRSWLFRISLYFKLIALSLHLESAPLQEETLKRLTKSEVHQVIEALWRHSLFAVEGAKIGAQTSQLLFAIDKK